MSFLIFTQSAPQKQWKTLRLQETHDITPKHPRISRHHHVLFRFKHKRNRLDKSSEKRSGYKKRLATQNGS